MVLDKTSSKYYEQTKGTVTVEKTVVRERLLLLWMTVA